MMTEINASEQARLQRLDEASQWLLALQSAQRADDELSEWFLWIDADPENLAEFERLQRDWIDLDALKEDALHLTRRQKSVLRKQEERCSAARYITSGFAARRPTWAIAAGIAAVAVVAVALLHYTRTSPSTPTHQLTAATTSRAATLPDGSQMILGVQSRVNMDFTGTKRQLDLSNGEAYFKVKHDKLRPFVVQVGEVSITAIGTAFDVRRDQAHVAITVEEGTVDVTSHIGGERPVTWRTEAGYQLTYSTRDRTAALANVNPAAELAWRNGELAYVREPLGAVVENLNRYSARKIVIDDPEIAALSFTGTAFAAALDDWLAGVEQAYPLITKRTDTGDIILTASKEQD